MEFSNQKSWENGWFFTREETADFMSPQLDEQQWKLVNLPHDWAIAGPFSPDNDADITIIDPIREITYDYHHPGRSGGLPHVGKGFYRKHFTLESVPEYIRVEFDGIMANSRIYCNGKLAGGRPYGYSSFAVDLTPYVAQGENILAVEAENLPKASRWYPGGGIYRHTRLITGERIHFAHWGIRLSTCQNQLSAKLSVVNPDKKNISVDITIQNPAGETVLSEKLNGVKELSQNFTIPAPCQWFPDNPQLYTFTAVLGNEVQTCRFGLRDLEFNANNGFFINGKNLKFQGVCLHHDLGIIGAAVNRDVTKYRLLQLKTIGCNAIRTSHNPPDPELLELCDELGFLVICEAFDEWKRKKTPNGYNLYFDEWSETDLRDMIKRDANHPAVIMWSIGNEIDEQYFPEGAEMCRRLCEICHDEDPTRPVTAGLNNGDDSITGGLFDIVDVKGFNYKPYIYSVYHHNFPNAAIYSSESASTISSRGEYSDRIFEELGKKDNLLIDSFDLCNSPGATTPDHEFKGQDDNPFVMGEFVWTGFDYLGEPTPYQNEWPSRSSYYGIFDLCQIPKDRAYLYRSRWTKDPVLHLMPHWNWEGYENRMIPVQCYSSYDKVELLVNGVSMGIREKNPKKIFGHYRLIWNSVPYQAGELRARALDFHGNVLAETVINTAGKPHHITAESERCGEMVFVILSVVDEHGNLCPHSSERLDFASNGEIIAADGGDQRSTKPFSLPYSNCFHGKCAVFLRTKEKNNLEVKACLNGKETTFIFQLP